ncbi:MAG: ABC transporter substrate-binding protein [Opitutales bacterium]|nr:ABC transporter substrate-binding protein [Opitutales bacterium]
MRISAQTTTAPGADGASRSGGRLRVGYVPLIDSAPLVIAQTHGFFERAGLEVELVREVGWASVREKIRLGELDGAQAPASMVFELSEGLGVLPEACFTGLVTAHHGNALVLSMELWELGVRDAHSLARVVRAHRGKRRFIFAGVLNYSSQNYLMRRWLLSGGLRPEQDVDLAMVPPPQVRRCLEAGHLDGFCVAEPWGSAVIAAGLGWSPDLSADFDPGHPEKVFLVTDEFHRRRPSDHMALLTALLAAARFCEEPRNRRGVAQVLAQPGFLDLPEEILRPALVGPYPMGCERERPGDDVIRFAGEGINAPTEEKARWVLEEIARHGLSRGMAPLSTAAIAARFRMDVFEEAAAMVRFLPPPPATAEPVSVPPAEGPNPFS